LKTRSILVLGVFVMLASSGLSDVIFQDDFEKGLSKENWGDCDLADTSRVRVVEGTVGGLPGGKVVEYTAKVGQGTGGHMVHWFMPGYDKIHVRWYVKFAPDFDQGNHMHLCWLTGNRVDNKWSAFGKAGIKPNGRDFFVTNLEPNSDWGRNKAPGEWVFYTYYPDMKVSPDGKHWGNIMKPDKKCLIERGRWYCVEMRVKLNDVGRSNGEQAFWVDGREIGRWRGIRWRDTEDLKLNCFALDLYVHDSKQVNKVWFDRVVISTDYVGPAPKS
jgi:hypothetical protein